MEKKSDSSTWYMCFVYYCRSISKRVHNFTDEHEHNPENWIRFEHKNKLLFGKWVQKLCYSIEKCGKFVVFWTHGQKLTNGECDEIDRLKYGVVGRYFVALGPNPTFAFIK